MSDPYLPMTSLTLPAELVAKIEELKKDREEDRNKSVQDLVTEFCQTYVKVRELARWERAHAADINRSYEEQPNDWGDTEVWKAASQPSKEESQ